MAGEETEPRSPSEATKSAGPGGSDVSSRAPTDSRGTRADFPELESRPFNPGDSPEPAERVGVDEGELDLAPPEPIVWTPERAGYLLRGAGFALHAADGAASEEGGDDLWRMTEADLEAMGPPLAAILNRYDAARRLAGLSEEGALAFGLAAYAKRNLATRGRVLAIARARDEGTVLDESAPPFQRPEPGDDAWREGREGQPPGPPPFGAPDPPAGT